MNPGVICEKEYACLSDVVIIFESSFKKYKNQNDWEWTIDSQYKNKIAHLIYETPQNNLADVLKIATAKKASYLYVTNDSKNDGNPWDSLPNYWEKEVSEFRK